MRAGKLRHRVSIQRATETRDDDGGVIETWATVAQRWARITAVAGNERVVAQQFIGVVSHEIEMRYYDGLLITDRIQWGGRNFNIEAIINPDERKITHLLAATELL